MVLVMNAQQLRAVADAAESLRNPDGGQDPFYVVYEEGQKPQIMQSAGPPPNAVFELDTLEVEPRPTPSRVVIECDGVTRELVQEYDAVFWSESAVEKFVLPYYASKSMWEAAAVLDKISMYWYGEIPPATDPSGPVDDLVAESTEPLPPPYALAHTPDSEWSVLDGLGSPTGHNLHLLVKDGEAIRAVRLSDLPDPPRPHARSGTAGPARRTHAATGGA